jgi:NADPH-dependent 2,4-dienoyl-CoA reductase/sulfur reductase-like enzyme
LTGEWAPERAYLPAAAADEEQGVDWLLGRTAVGLDVDGRRVVLDDGTEVSFDGLVIATGCRPLRLPGPDVHVIRTLDDAVRLRAALDAGPRRVVVIGAGFIGSEVAASCRARGLAVTMIEALPVPLERILGREMGEVCADLHRAEGVDLRLGVGVDAIEEGGVRLADGTAVEANVVVVGIGVRPNTEWLEGSGLTLDNGVVCDETCLAAPGIVAAGDVARWPNQRFGGDLMRVEHWDNALEQGAAAARRLLADDGDAEPYAPVPWFWSDQYDRKIQLSGLSSNTDDVRVVHGDVGERRFVALYGREGRLVGALGWNRPRHVMQWRQRLVDGLSWDEALAVAAEDG